MSNQLNFARNLSALTVVGSSRGLEARVAMRNVVSDGDVILIGSKFADVLSMGAPVTEVANVEAKSSLEKEPSGDDQKYETARPLANSAIGSGNDIAVFEIGALVTPPYQFSANRESIQQTYSNSDTPSPGQTDVGGGRQEVKPEGVPNPHSVMPEIELSQLTDLRVETQHLCDLRNSDRGRPKSEVGGFQSGQAQSVKTAEAAVVTGVTSNGFEALIPSRKLPAPAMPVALLMPGSAKVDRRELAEVASKIHASRGPGVRADGSRPVTVAVVVQQVAVDPDSALSTEDSSVFVADPGPLKKDGEVRGRDNQMQDLKEGFPRQTPLLSANSVTTIRTIIESTLGNVGKSNSFDAVGSPNIALSADSTLLTPLKTVQFTLPHDGGGSIRLKLAIVDGSLSVTIATDNARLGSHLKEERQRLESDLQESGYAVREVIVETIPIKAQQKEEASSLEQRDFDSSHNAKAGQGRGEQAELGGSRQERNRKSPVKDEHARVAISNAARVGQYV